MIVTERMLSLAYTEGYVINENSNAAMINLEYFIR